ASRSLPLILAIGGIRSVTVVTSAWHLRTRLFFAPYRWLGLPLSFAWAIDLPSPRLLWHELYGMRFVRAQRRRAMSELRLPAEPAASAHETSPRASLSRGSLRSMDGSPPAGSRSKGRG